jgi:hypothetical protein
VISPMTTRLTAIPNFSFSSRSSMPMAGAATVVSDGSGGLLRRPDRREQRVRRRGVRRPSRAARPWTESVSCCGLAPGRLGGSARRPLRRRRWPRPFRVTATLKPVSMTEPKPGVFIFDLGQNMVGWCVDGTGPCRNRSSHCATLKRQADGNLLYRQHPRRKVTDVYTP